MYFPVLGRCHAGTSWQNCLLTVLQFQGRHKWNILVVLTIDQLLFLALFNWFCRSDSVMLAGVTRSLADPYQSAAVGF